MRHYRYERLAILARIPAPGMDRATLAAALAAAGAGDADIEDGGDDLAISLAFSRDAETYEIAAEEAVAEVRQALPGATSIRTLHLETVSGNDEPGLAAASRRAALRLAGRPARVEDAYA